MLSGLGIWILFPSIPFHPSLPSSSQGPDLFLVFAALLCFKRCLGTSPATSIHFKILSATGAANTQQAELQPLLLLLLYPQEKPIAKNNLLTPNTNSKICLNSSLLQYKGPSHQVPNRQHLFFSVRRTNTIRNINGCPEFL